MTRMPLPLLLLAFATAGHASDVFRVSATGGTHSSLQSAIDACGPAGCRIELTDSVYRFDAPVTILRKSDIDVVGARPDGRRPILAIADEARTLVAIPDLDGFSASRTHPAIWETTAPDTVVDPDGSIDILDKSMRMGGAGLAARFLVQPGRAVGGGTHPRRPSGWLLAPYTMAHAEMEFDRYDDVEQHLHAALILVDSSRSIRFSGLEFDGGSPIAFQTLSLWADRYGLTGGVAAVSFNASLDGEVSDCDVHDWYTGIRAVDNNRGGLVSDLMATDLGADQGFWFLRPLADPGSMGGHRIEGNLGHHNFLFVDLEQSWDLGSSIRFNRAWENGNTRILAASGRSPRADFDIEAWGLGGFLHLKDVVYPTTIVQGNTLVRNTLDIEQMGYRASTAPLFFDNLSVRRDQQRDWRELTNILGTNARHNWLASTAKASMGWPTSGDSIVPFCSATPCSPYTPAWGSAAVDRRVVDAGLFGDDLGAVWRHSRTAERIHVQDQTLGYVEKTSQGWSVTLAIPVEAASSVSDLRITLAQAGKISLQGTTLTSNTQEPTVLDGVVGLAVSPGVNLATFDLPAGTSDTIWRVELALSGVDGNTGEAVHSNLGTWLVRPLGKQLRVTRAEAGIVTPGETVAFRIEVKDSLGDAAILDQAPELNAPGWTSASIPGDGGAAARSHAAVGSTSFLVHAKAPTQEGISRVVFWSAENGRLQAVAGAAYVMVGSGSSAVGPRASAGRGWRVAGTSRRGSERTLMIAGTTPELLAGASLRDAKGRRAPLSTSPSGRDLVVPASLAGTYFLTVGSTTAPLILLP